MLKKVEDSREAVTCSRTVSSRIWCALCGLVPQFFLTRVAEKIASVRWSPFKTVFINVFIRLFAVDMSEARRGAVADYENFGDFFTRELRPGIRPLAGAGHLCSPVDGAISQAGSLDNNSILQFKGMYYDLGELFAGYTDLAASFTNGSFVCLYLAPRDYHRVHAPVDCVLSDLLHVPGRLFGVGHSSVRYIPGLFSRNERLLMLFDSRRHGRIAVIMVGACMVGSIGTVWTGKLSAFPSQLNYTRQEPGKNRCDQGDCMARFYYGSTVIVLTEPGRFAVDSSLEVDSRVLMGQSLGRLS